MAISSVRDKRLFSLRQSEILDALYELGGRCDLPPNDQEIAQLLLLLRHSDAEIRELAVNTAGIRWRLKESYPIIKNMLAHEERDQSVLRAVCGALCLLVEKKIGKLEDITKLMGLIALNTELDPILRGTAYINLKIMYKLISVKDFAASSRDIKELNFDSEWVKSLI